MKIAEISETELAYLVRVLHDITNVQELEWKLNLADATMRLREEIDVGDEIEENAGSVYIVKEDGQSYFVMVEKCDDDASPLPSFDDEGDGDIDESEEDEQGETTL